MANCKELVGGVEMIRTRFGTEVDVVGGDMGKAEVDVRMLDGTILKVFVYDLKAEGGLSEIIEAISKANQKYNLGGKR